MYCVAGLVILTQPLGKTTLKLFLVTPEIWPLSCQDCSGKSLALIPVFFFILQIIYWSINPHSEFFYLQNPVSYANSVKYASNMQNKQYRRNSLFCSQKVVFNIRRKIIFIRFFK